jgi:membrane-associated protease RseP (regulator of RpoE activity)
VRIVPIELPCFRENRVWLQVLSHRLFSARTRMRMMPFSRISSRCRVAGNTVGVFRRFLFAAATLACGGPVAIAADEAPAAGGGFQPEDISIGEPISLPTAPPLAPPSPAAAPIGGVLQPPAAQLPSVVVPDHPAPTTATAPAGAQSLATTGASPQQATAGSGWLGIAVDDTLVTGRLVVVEVAPDGPAAKAGIRPQDMLLAMNGTPLQTGDELAATLAAIAPGQQVKMVVGRDNKIEDVVAQASVRPPAAVSRDWQSSASTAPPYDAVAAPPLAAPPLAAPTRLLPAAPSYVGELPTPAATSALTPPGMLPAATQPARASAANAGAMPQLPSVRQATSGRTALGVRTVPVDPDVQSRFHLSDTHGAFVIGVVQDLPASKAGVPPGSVIVAINHQPVRSPQDLTQLVSHGPVGTPVPIQYVLPGGQSKQADVVLQSLEQPLERALTGSDSFGRTADTPSLQPAVEPSPLTTRRVQPMAAYQSAEPDPLSKMEELLRLMSNRLEQIERRLDRIEAGRP